MRTLGADWRSPLRPRSLPALSELWSALFSAGVVAVVVMSMVSGWSTWAVDQFGPPGEQIPLVALQLFGFVSLGAIGWRSGRRGGPTAPAVARVLHVLHHDRGGQEYRRSARRLAWTAALSAVVVAVSGAVSIAVLIPGVASSDRVVAAVGGALGAVGVFFLAARASGSIDGRGRARPLAMLGAGCAAAICGVVLAGAGVVSVLVAAGTVAIAFPLCIVAWDQRVAVDLGLVMERSEAMSVAGVALVHRDVRALVRTSEFGPGSRPTSSPSPRFTVRSAIARRWLWSYARRSPQLATRHGLALGLSVGLAWMTAAWPPAGVILVPALWWLAVLTIEPLAVELELHALSRTLVRGRGDVLRRSLVALAACAIAVGPAYTLLILAMGVDLFEDAGPTGSAVLVATTVLLGSVCALAGAVRTVTSHTDDLLTEWMVAQPEAYGLAVATSEAIPFLLVGSALTPAALTLAGAVVTVAGYARVVAIVAIGVGAWTFVRLHRSLDPSLPTVRQRLRAWR